MSPYPRIRSMREDADITQEQLSKAVGVSSRTYAYYETGQRTIPPHVLCAIGDFFQVSVDYLLNRTNQKKLNE